MLTAPLLPQALAPWLTAVESIVTGQRSSVPVWHWAMMGMPRLTRLELGISLKSMSLKFMSRLTQLTTLSLDMIEDSDETVDSEGEEVEVYDIDPSVLCPLSALRELRELRLVHSCVPELPPSVSNLSNLLYLEFHTDRAPPCAVVPSLKQLTQLQALVLRGNAVDVMTPLLDSGLTRLVNLRVLVLHSQAVPTHDFTNSFAAFHMSGLQVLSLSGSCRLRTHWLSQMHQLRVLAICSNALVGALPAHIMPLLKFLIISEKYEDGVPCTQPVLHVDTLPSVIDRMQAPKPLTVVCREILLVGKMPAAQVRTLSSTGNFLVLCNRMPVKRIHLLVLHMLSPFLKQLCIHLPDLTGSCVVEYEFD